MIGVLEELKLSKGEERVLLLTVAGMLDKEVAEELGLSLHTVRSFWRRIRHKFGRVPRAEVVARVARMSLERELGEQVDENERLLKEIARRREAEAEATRRARLLDLAHDAIIVWELGGGIQYWNRGAEELYGYESAEVVGLSPQELLKTVYPRSLAEAESELVRKLTWSGMLRHTTKSGLQVVVESRHSLVREEGMPLSVMESNRDVTRRVESERHLQVYQDAFENARVGLAVDDGTRLTYVNAEFARMHGYERQELEGLPLEFLFTQAERESVQELDERIAEAGAAILSEEHVRKNGETFAVVKQLTAVKDDAGRLLYRTITAFDAASVRTWEEFVSPKTEAPERSPRTPR